MIKFYWVIYVSNITITAINLNIDVEQIIYIENSNRKTLVVTSEREYLVREPFKAMCRKLTELSDSFVHSHQSYMVNLNYVTDFDLYNVTLKSGKKVYNVHISRRRYKEFKEKMEEFG